MFFNKKLSFEKNQKEYTREYIHMRFENENDIQPYYKELSDVVTGKVVPQLTSEEKTKYGITDEEETDSNGIPDFWLKALERSEFYPLSKKDVKVLEHLNDVSYQVLEDERVSL